MDQEEKQNYIESLKNNREKEKEACESFFRSSLQERFSGTEKYSILEQMLAEIVDTHMKEYDAKIFKLENGE